MLAGTVFDGCTTDEDCSAAVANSECSSFQCVCKIGYQMERDKKTCKKAGMTSPIKYHTTFSI